MISDRLVEITVISEHTAQVRTWRAAHLLEQAGVPRLFDGVAGVWMTSTRTLPTLIAWLGRQHRPMVIVEHLQAAS